MSGMCSAHLWYERDCGQCQSEKPTWVIDLDRQLAEANAARDVAELDLHTLQDAFALVMQERDAANAALQAVTDTYTEALMREAEANAALAEVQANVMELEEDGKALSDSHHKQHEELVATRAALAEVKEALLYIADRTTDAHLEDVANKAIDRIEALKVQPEEKETPA